MHGAGPAYRKQKMSIRLRLYNWLIAPFRNQPDETSPVKAIDSDGFDTSGFSLQVYPATGGTVIKIRHFYVEDGNRTGSQRKDHSSIHVIPEENELSESVAKIVSMELLRQR